MVSDVRICRFQMLRVLHGLGAQARPLSNHSTFEEMRIGGIQAYLLGLTG
jgi:hypothetical protein